MSNDKVEVFKAEDFKSSEHNGGFVGLSESAQLVAARANKLLAERSQVVTGRKLGESNLTDQHRAGWMFAEPHVFPVSSESEDTHTALLVGIRPIVRDTAESLLREMIAAGDVVYSSALTQYLERARRLLERKEGE